jgi:nitroimidazol reductase NimA-like FMN-containing flavoprotein (pyridoxamine 5'-phosphate oxidase superfamily)
MPIPAWFEWDGERARLFTMRGTAKIRRMEADSRVALLTSNNPDEQERWVLIKGQATVLASGGWALAQRLASRYWDLDDPVRAATLRSWGTMSNDWDVVEITPDAILSSAGD